MPTTQPAPAARPGPAPLWALIVAGAIFIVTLACNAEPPAPPVDPVVTTPATDAGGL